MRRLKRDVDMAAAHRKRKRNPSPDSEQAIQEAVAKYLDALGVLWFHPPLEGKRSPVAGAKLKRAGMKKGVPDVLVFTPPPGRSDFVGVALELKRKKAAGHTLSEYDRITCSSVTPEQSVWLLRLADEGWYVAVRFGFDEVVQTMRDLGYDKGAA